MPPSCWFLQVTLLVSSLRISKKRPAFKQVTISQQCTYLRQKIDYSQWFFWQILHREWKEYWSSPHTLRQNQNFLSQKSHNFLKLSFYNMMRRLTTFQCVLQNRKEFSLKQNFLLLFPYLDAFNTKGKKTMRFPRQQKTNEALSSI